MPGSSTTPRAEPTTLARCSPTIFVPHTVSSTRGKIHRSYQPIGSTLGDGRRGASRVARSLLGGPVQFWFGDLALTRVLLQRGLAAIYLLASWCVIRQFRPLLGERGLLPVPDFLQRVTFREAPSLFHFRYSDRLLAGVGWAGLGLSVLAVTGVSERGPLWLSLAVWLTLYVLYLSIVNVGQTFYGFGWESMLLEAGFFAAFLGPSHVRPSPVPILILRWMLFRVELGAGLIKLRGDACWRDLTCLYYHHETQPLPNPLSWRFHHLPAWTHRAEVLGNHAAQLVAPWLLFLPQPVAGIGAVLMIVTQCWLLLSGNFSWLNL